MCSIIEEINQLKKENDAVILSHYYVDDSVQAISDYIGDSFYLSRLATTLTARTLILCGVSFMGESAAILNPDKTVLMPDITADCPMAHMADIDTINKMRKEYEDLAVVCYINSTAELKMHSDVCVTSSNAVKIVKSLPNKNIFFIPDEHLGNYVAELVPEKNIISNKGYCPVHTMIAPSDVLSRKEEHPDALVLTHPECPKNILDISDYVGSTLEILNYAKNSDNKEFIICTETGILYKLKEECPDKIFYTPAKKQCCADMKLITLEKILDSLKNPSAHVIKADENTIKYAVRPLSRMLELAK